MAVLTIEKVTYKRKDYGKIKTYTVYNLVELGLTKYASLVTLSKLKKVYTEKGYEVKIVDGGTCKVNY